MAWIALVGPEEEENLSLRYLAELKARGVEFTGGVSDPGYTLVTHFKVVRDYAVQLYQPQYEKRFD